MPLYRRLPKRGFKNIKKKNIAIINVSDIVVTIAHILGNGILTGENFCRTDLNGDDLVNVIDAVLLVDIILN